MKIRTNKLTDIPETHELFAENPEIEEAGEFRLGTLTQVEPGQWKFSSAESDDRTFIQKTEDMPPVPGQTIQEAAEFVMGHITMHTVKLPANRLEDDLMCITVEQTMAALMRIADKADCHSGLILGLAKSLAMTIVDDLEESEQKPLLETFLTVTREACAKRRARSHIKDLMGDLLREVLTPGKAQKA